MREAHPLTDIDFSRYKQVQISGYRDLGGTTLGNGEVVRDIEIGVVNRHTLAERTVRYRERWRYDEAAKTWWLVGGLPDLWDESAERGFASAALQSAPRSRPERPA